jgi:MinD-like ATPase involved in chromosome partitioning or flagellar assembly
MLDQAHDLRELTQRRERFEPPPRDKRPATLVVLGGKGGVGATTVGLNVAHAMTCAGRQTLFLSADPLGESATLFSGRMETKAAVEKDRATWNAYVRQSPSFPFSQPEVELVVIDAGHALDGGIASWCCEADAVLMVATREPASVVHAFAVIKQVCGKSSSRHAPCADCDTMAGGAPRVPPTVYLAINRCPSARAAATVHDRLAWACHRLLGIEIQSAGHLRTVSSFKKKQSLQSFGLNFPALSVDTLRSVLLADAMLNWRKDAKFDGRPRGEPAGRKEAKRSRRNS